MNHRAAAAFALAIAAALVIVKAGASATLGSQADPRARLTTTVDPVISALWAGFNPQAAMDHVRFISQYWRLAGNPGYNASIDRIRTRLAAAGLKPVVEEYPNTGLAWDHSVGTLSLVVPGDSDDVVLSREKDRLPLCINSFSTPAGGVVARLVDVGRGREEDYAGKDLKGAVVLGDTDAGQLWRRAVTTGGAIGVISTTLPAYLNADAPGDPPTPRDEWDILQWGSVPYDEARKGFGFKASPRAAVTLRKRLAAATPASPVSVRVTIASTFTAGPVRTLVAEIPGRTAPNERIVLAAHVQEPGANDNASGVATLAEAAAALAAAIQQKKVPAPERTLTFLFLNEISGSRRWLQDHPDAAKQVRYMFSLDMTGEDVKKTGGSFLIERYPDPGAVWDRPWDPHSEWGRGNVRADSLKGDVINDAHLFVARQVAARTGWVVKSNPYEGGSDHTVFGQAGVPSVLDWHFTDRYYHTNFDTPDKTSAEEMRNVAVAVAASAWLLASASPMIATDVAEVVAAAGRERIAVETTEGAKLAAAAADPAAARVQEATIVAAWKKWYAEAVRSASRLVVGTPSASFAAEIARIASAFESAPSAGFTLAERPGSTGPILNLRRGVPSTSLWGGSPAERTSFNARQAGADTTSIFPCGDDQTLPDVIPLRWGAVVLAGDGRLFQPCVGPRKRHFFNHREAREADVINRALRSRDPELRWRGAQAQVRVENVPPILGLNMPGVTTSGLGMMSPGAVVRPGCSARILVLGSAQNPTRWQPGQFFRLLIDENVRVRKEAAYAIGTSLRNGDHSADVVTGATAELRTCLVRETHAEVQGLILENLGIAKYATDADRLEAETYLVGQAQGESPKLLGAVKALDALIRQSPERPIALATRVFLRQMTQRGVTTIEPHVRDVDAQIRRRAMMALHAAGDTDAFTLAGAILDADWQVRRLAAMRINLSDPEHAPIGERLEMDVAFQVRSEFLTPLSRLAARTNICEPILKRFDDPSPVVVMRAMDVLVTTCTDLDEAVKKLIEIADELSRAHSNERWHVPVHALKALARLRPDEARARLPHAVEHAVWQVRAKAAELSVSLEDSKAPRALVYDSEPNVLSAAFEAQTRLKSVSYEAAIEALKTARDYQLLRVMALALKNTPEHLRAAASEALLGALRRLTLQESDTSRDPRVAIIERLGEVIEANQIAQLIPYATDFDDEVVAATRRAFPSLASGPSGERPLRRRYPFQPAEEGLYSLPTRAVIQLEEGAVVLELLPDVAPVTVARFAALAGEGFYKDRTFHRVVPNFVVQGGSPGANEYMGTSRYLRDEVGPQAPHVRGAVGISTRGGDTGDGQIFIDLVDLPRLDRDYTVFAYVTQGMELIDRLLEGAKIVNISVR